MLMTRPDSRELTTDTTASKTKKTKRKTIVALLINDHLSVVVRAQFTTVRLRLCWSTERAASPPHLDRHRDQPVATLAYAHNARM